jgi:hypothetical protein
MQLVAVSTAAVLGLSACSSAAAPAQQNSFSFTSASDALAYAKSHHYTADVGYLEDGVVTAEEYRAAESTYQSCLEGQGYTFGPVMVDPIGGLQLIYRDQYMGPKKSYNGNAVNACQDKFDPVEETYTQTNPQHMNPQLLSAVESCLTANGVAYPASASKVADFVKKLHANISPVLSKCINTEVDKLYPNIPVVAIAY